MKCRLPLTGKIPIPSGRYLERLALSRALLPFLFCSLRSIWRCRYFLWRSREWRFVWVPLTLLIFSLGANFYPYFYPHYIAAVTCLFVLVSVTGARSPEPAEHPRMAGRRGSRAAHCFSVRRAFSVLVRRALRDRNPSLIQYETSDFINHGDPQGRTAVQSQLAKTPGKQLVFVRYWPQHQFEQWVHNAADIDGRAGGVGPRSRPGRE